MTGSPEVKILCGPLLRYTYINHETSVWNGSIMAVVQGANPPAVTVQDPHETSSLKLLLCERGLSFWKFDVAVKLGEEGQKVKYTLVSKLEDHSEGYSFHVPGREETMRMMFYSCNEYSVGAKRHDGDLWKDVIQQHEKSPFHVMIGGGDQVYSDNVRTEGNPLHHWASTSLKEKMVMQFDNDLREKVDKWYLKNYLESYGGKAPVEASTGEKASNDTIVGVKAFKEAIACIPAIQILDDHDIIDGYGSYDEAWMKTPVFLGIGEVAWKYYVLFQHHAIPPNNEDSERMEEKADEPWLMLGTKDGPYIKARSRSICSTFGKRVMFFGLDCRAERTKTRICYEETYDMMFELLKNKLDADQTKQTKHLILLLSLPLAYPRLVWLEKLLSTSFAEKILKGNQINKFDGKPELLDDLNDHWCSEEHKEERNGFVKRLQEFSKEENVRITILSGDVHLACVGRFFHKKSLAAPPQNEDHRYMVNIVSSAITNRPPHRFIALATHLGNRLHKFKLDKDTRENLMPMFDKDPKTKWYKPRINHTTLSARNYCVITENAGSERVSTERMSIAYKQKGRRRDPSDAAHQDNTKRKYSLEVAIHAEVDPREDMGRTTAYEFSIPILENVVPKTETAQ